MRNDKSKLHGARNIGIGTLIALSSATPAFAADWLTDWASTWTPPTGYMGYLFYGALGVFVVAVILKAFEAYGASSETRPLPSESANEEPRAYSIGEHRNSMLNPYN